MATKQIRLQDLNQYDDLFQKAEEENGLPSGLIKALAWQESRLNPNAHNKKSGAHGITQWMAKSAKGWKVNRYDVASSIDGTGRYLRSLIDRFGGRVDLALAGYNGGEGNIERWLKDGTWITNDAHVRPKENIEYPEKVFGHMGINYKSPGSPKLGKGYTRFAKGKNATPIMPNDESGQSLYSSEPTTIAQLFRETQGVPAQYNVGLPTNSDVMPISSNEDLESSAPVLPQISSDNQSIIQAPNSDLAFTIPPTQSDTNQIAQELSRGLITIPQYIR